MKDYSLLKDLLPYLEKYENLNKSSGAGGVADFSVWLQKEAHDNRIKDFKGGIPGLATTRQSEDIRTTISRMVYMMYRYARFYTKKAMVNSSMTSLDDFALLATLRTRKNVVKGELIKMFVLDKTTGIEIVNRLIRNGLAVQQNSAEDKRNKKIAITEKGKKELNVIFAEMAKTSAIVTGSLAKEEQLELIRLLTKLERFHHELVNTNGLETIDQFANTAALMRAAQLGKGT